LVRSNKNKQKANAIISKQKQLVEDQKAVVEIQKEQVEEKNKNITDSINYARRIQNALLQSENEVKLFLPDYFILFKPKDIVSGDFYWFFEKQGTLYFSVVDCTGHGVPGAFMSMLGMNFLNDILQTEEVPSPAYILNRLSEKVVERLKQKNINSQTKDGMDMALCSLSENKNKLQFSGANNPLIIIRDKQIIEIGGDRIPIGHQGLEEAEEFTTKVTDIQKGDCIYLFSDGYTDQFGGEKGKKFKSKQLYEKLAEINKESMSEQKNILERTFEDWRGNMEQIDDVCIIGIRL
jgi:serine phosphatase RsbU (regulator of sigma subunit)